MFTWRADFPTGAEPSLDQLEEAGLAQSFDSQALAEQWLAEFWSDLDELGATAVTLLEADRVVYGPMPLDA